MKSSILTGSLVLSVLLASQAFAGKVEVPPEVTPVPNVAVAGAAAVAGSSSSSEAAAVSDSSSDSSSSSGSESAASSHQGQGQEQGQGQGQDQGQKQGQSVSTVDNSNYFNLGRGVLIPVDCGAGFDAGGANRNGAGFFGMTWTTDKCYTFKTGSAFAAMGEYEIACELYSDVARKALKRRGIKVNCSDVARNVRIQRESSDKGVILVPPTDSVSRKEFQETIERVFKTTQSK